jgi:hypothetical protein
MSRRVCVGKLQPPREHAARPDPATRWCLRERSTRPRQTPRRRDVPRRLRARLGRRWQEDASNRRRRPRLRGWPIPAGFAGRRQPGRKPAWWRCWARASARSGRRRETASALPCPRDVPGRATGRPAGPRAWRGGLRCALFSVSPCEGGYHLPPTVGDLMEGSDVRVHDAIGCVFDKGFPSRPIHRGRSDFFHARTHSIVASPIQFPRCPEPQHKGLRGVLQTIEELVILQIPISIDVRVGSRNGTFGPVPVDPTSRTRLIVHTRTIELKSASKPLHQRQATLVARRWKRRLHPP